MSAARQAANRSLDDRAAAIELAERLDADTTVLGEAAIDLARHRDDYISDRAYRLLSAAVAGTAVQPIPPERRDLFAEEEAIGRMPIEQAFRHLAEIEPRLLGVRRQTQVSTQDEHAQDRLLKHLGQLLHGLVGRGASADHELLRTNLASSIVHQYLWQLTGASQFGDPTTAYFDSPTQRVVATHAFGDPKRPRPQ